MDQALKANNLDAFKLLLPAAAAPDVDFGALRLFYFASSLSLLVCDTGARLFKADNTDNTVAFVTALLEAKVPRCSCCFWPVH